MRSCGGGKRKAFFLVVALAFNVKGLALERQAWVFEQLGALPAVTKKNEPRYQASFQAVSYMDTFSTQGMALLDLREFEIGVKGSQRMFAAVTDRGAEVRDNLIDDQSSASVEIARHYVGDTGVFGRMGVEAFHFFPSTRRWVKIGFSTGRVPLPSYPWELKLSTNVFVSVTGAGAYVSVRGETARALADGSAFSLGGFLNWNYRLRPADKPGRYEHMLFSFGPLLDWRTSFGSFRAHAPLRLWIDRHLYDDNGVILTARAAELSPDVGLSWTLVL